MSHYFFRILGLTSCIALLACDSSIGEGSTPTNAVLAACPPAGDSNYCRDCGPCADGIGDCDDDSECAGGLICASDVGAQYGFGPSVDVCVPACPPAGDSNYCRDCGPCAEGVGDCDDDSECAGGSSAQATWVPSMVLGRVSMCVCLPVPQQETRTTVAIVGLARMALGIATRTASALGGSSAQATWVPSMVLGRVLMCVCLPVPRKEIRITVAIVDPARKGLGIATRTASALGGSFAQATWVPSMVLGRVSMCAWL